MNISSILKRTIKYFREKAFIPWMWEFHYFRTINMNGIPLLPRMVYQRVRICISGGISHYIKDITRWRKDMNFMFEWQEQCVTSERSEPVKYCSCHENIKFISSSQRVMFFSLCKHGVFDDFPKISDFPKKILNCSKGQTNAPEQIPKISEDVWRLPKIAEDFQGRPEDVQWYTNEFKCSLRDKLDISEIIDIFTCEVIISHMWGYRIVFINLLPLGIPLTFI